MISFYLQREMPLDAPLFLGACINPDNRQQLRGRLSVIAVKLRAKEGPPVYLEFIDTKLHRHCRLVDEVRADSWLAAKKALGFPLSANQSEMLAKLQTKKLLEKRAA